MKKYFYFLAIAVLFAACQPNNDLGTPFQKGQKVTLSATIANPNSGAKQMPGKQRVSGLDDNPSDPTNGAIKLTWNKGDQIKVTVNGQSEIFTLIGDGGSDTGEFEGFMPAEGTTYTVDYPVTIPNLANQTYVKNGFGDELMTMHAENGDLSGFTLEAQNALLGLQLKGSKALSDIVVTNSKTNDTYTLDCKGVTLKGEATLFYIVVPAGTWANGFKVEVLQDDKSLIADFEKTTSAIFTANQAVVMDTKVADYELKTLTFEDWTDEADKSFDPYELQYDEYFTIETWSDLIDETQDGNGMYMGGLLYGSGLWDNSSLNFYPADWSDPNYRYASCYCWYDENNTKLCNAFGYFGSGGMAISNYVEQHGYIQDYSKQLTAYATAGNNGSDNFCMVCTGQDMSGSGSMFTSFAFADEVARVIDHMYVANCVLTNGQLYNGSEELKIRAVGIAEDDSETELEFTLVENGTAIEDWKEWKLTKLGKVKQVNFYVEGGDSFDMIGGGIPQPSFAFDDVAVRFQIEE